MPVKQVVKQAQQPQVEDLLIKGEELVQLNNLIEQVPTKWGFGLVAFFQSVGMKRQQEKAAQVEAVPAPETPSNKK